MGDYCAERFLTSLCMTAECMTSQKNLTTEKYVGKIYRL